MAVPTNKPQCAAALPTPPEPAAAPQRPHTQKATTRFFFLSRPSGAESIALPVRLQHHSFCRSASCCNSTTGGKQFSLVFFLNDQDGSNPCRACHDVCDTSAGPVATSSTCASFPSKPLCLPSSAAPVQSSHCLTSACAHLFRPSVTCSAPAPLHSGPT